MFNYQLTGAVLPERAQISFGHPTAHPFLLSSPKGDITINVCVVLNQVTVWVKSPFEWGIFDLRNEVATIVRHQLAIAGFLLGHAYNLEVTRVTTPDGNIDWVYGIDIPCLTERMKGKLSSEAFTALIVKTSGPKGFILHRCFTDLTLAMQHPVDTAFYCYRAIESLRQHWGALNDVEEKATQWKGFRDFLGISKDSIDPVRIAAEGVRHGELVSITDQKRVELFTRTWDLVEAYLNKVQDPRLEK
ncbi:hypothetical protein ACFOLJ_24270 [Rugamonas sp. CCM 8940]|uniref:hypothetical protein n=1 Tax=Rugamonas sp. CCM 8940 TaxID=2765359 RepID=UPI0018F6EF3C|nr:hypothetical protein [Rugamonas sp. CCM 8940]MBJ7310507.1 hypothetical protein [Rugamonas sp. CCM 8940]